MQTMIYRENNHYKLTTSHSWFSRPNHLPNEYYEVYCIDGTYCFYKCTNDRVYDCISKIIDCHVNLLCNSNDDLEIDNENVLSQLNYIMATIKDIHDIPNDESQEIIKHLIDEFEALIEYRNKVFSLIEFAKHIPYNGNTKSAKFQLKE